MSGKYVFTAGMGLAVTQDQPTAEHFGKKAPEQRALAYFLLWDLFIFIAARLSPETTYKMLENKVSEEARDSKGENVVEKED